MLRKTNFVLTLNNYTEEEELSIPLLVEQKLCSYFCYGKEVGASGTPHLQCFARTRAKMSIATFQRKIAEVTGIASRYSVIVAKGSLPGNRDYCAKGEQSHDEWETLKCDGPNYGKNADFHEFGQHGQGRRTDLQDVSEAIRLGRTEKDIAEAHGEQYMKYYRGIRELIAMTQTDNDPRSSRTIGYWCWGPTGTGKSRWAHSLPGGVYFKAADTKWFDGFVGQETCVLDDFRPNKEITFSKLLQLADYYPMVVETKGGCRQFNAKRLIVTTPLNIDETFAHIEFLKEGSIAQLKRRFMELEFGPGKLTHLTSLQEIQNASSAEES